MSRQNLLAKTLELYQQDHPMPAWLAGTDNPWPVLQEQARMHEQNRLDTIAETLALISILAAVRIISLQEPVTVQKAIYQVGKGSREGKIAAAHCLPGHLVFGSAPLHRLADWKPAILENQGLKSLPMACMLRGLFGRTDYVDVLINQTDSYLEMMSGDRGLKPLFGQCAQRLLSHVENEPGKAWRLLQPLIRDALDYYRSHAALIYTERLDDLAANKKLALDKESAHKIDMKIFVVATMRSIVTSPGFMPTCVTVHGFPTLLDQVVRLQIRPDFGNLVTSG